MSQEYQYSVSSDMPGGKVSLSNLVAEIEASSIVTALDKVSTRVAGDALYVVFKEALSAADKTTLDGDTSAPAGGLLAQHDSTVLVSPAEVRVANAPTVQLRPPSGPARVYFFSADLTKKETWWHEAVKQEEVQVGTGNGVNQTFQLPHGESSGSPGSRVLNIHSGLVTEEDNIVPPGGASHADAVPVIKVDGVVMQEQSPFSSTGGDYTINYETGVLTFLIEDIPGNGAAVTAEYYYVPASAKVVLKARASASGKRIEIEHAEAQFSDDVSMQGTLKQHAYSLQLGDTVPGEAPTRYKTIGNIFDFNMGSLPQLPAIAGSTGRGMSRPTIVLPFGYLSRLTLNYDDEVELRVEVENGKEFTGERATITLYGLESDVEEAA